MDNLPLGSCESVEFMKTPRQYSIDATPTRTVSALMSPHRVVRDTSASPPTPATLTSPHRVVCDASASPVPTPARSSIVMTPSPTIGSAGVAKIETPRHSSFATQRVGVYNSGKLLLKPARPLMATSPNTVQTAGLLERNKVLEAQLEVAKSEMSSWKNKFDATLVKNERMQSQIRGLEETTSALDVQLNVARQDEENKANAELEVLRSRVAERELAIGNYREKFTAAQDDVHKWQSKTSDYEMNLQQKTAQLAESNRLEREAAEKSAHLEKQLKEMSREKQQLLRKVGQNEQMVEEFETLKKDYAALKTEVSQNKDANELSKLRIEGKTEIMAAYQTQIDAVNNMKNRCDNLQKENEVLLSRMKNHKELVQKVQDQAQNVKEANALAEMAETSQRRMAQQIEGKNEKLEEMGFKVSEAKRIIHELSREKAELEMKNKSLQGRKDVIEGLKDIAESKLLEVTKEQLQKAVEGDKTDMLPQLYSQVEQMTQQLESSTREVRFLKRQNTTKISGSFLIPTNVSDTALEDVQETDDAKMDLQAAMAMVQKYRKDKEKYKTLALDLQLKYEEKKQYYKTRVETWELENNQKTQSLEQALKQKATEMEEALRKKEQEVLAAKEATQAQQTGDKRSCDGETTEESSSKMPKSTSAAKGQDKGKGKGKGKGPPPPAPKAMPPPPGARKPVVVPFAGVKLRPLFWAPAQSSGSNSIWSSLMTTDCDKEQEKELEYFFLPKPDNRHTNIFQRRDSLKFLSVLDFSRQQPLAIQFRSIPRPAELLTIFEEGNHTRLTPDQALTLLKEGFVGDDVLTQIRTLQRFHPMTPLGLPEKYFMALSEIPDARDTLRVWVFIANFQLETSPMFEKLTAVRNGANGLRTCQEFSTLFSRLLTAGNRLNAGSLRSNYKAFSIESLPKFVELKSTDGSSKSLLEIVLKKVGGNMLSAIRSLYPIVEDSCVCMKDLEEQVKSVENEAQVLRDRVFGPDSTTKWHRCVADAEAALARKDELTKALQDAKDAVRQAMEYFGVPPTKPSEEFFRLWEQFLAQLIALSK